MREEILIIHGEWNVIEIEGENPRKFGLTKINIKQKLLTLFC